MRTVGILEVNCFVVAIMGRDVHCDCIRKARASDVPDVSDEQPLKLDQCLSESCESIVIGAY